MRSLFFCIVLLLATTMSAQNIGQPMWPGDVAIDLSQGNQGIGSAGGPGVAAVSDGSGGAILVWEDTFSGTIFAQRVNSSGVAQWTPGGVAVAPTGAFEMSPRAVSDGAGGAIIAWIDGRSPSIACNPGSKSDCFVAVQRINSSGAPQWGATGETVGKANQAPAEAAVIPDGSGGVVLVWETIAGSGDCCAFFAQDINAAGTPLWGSTTLGLQISPDPTHIIGVNGFPPAAVSDGAGGALIAYLFNQVDPLTQKPFTALQHIQAAGTLGFSINGIAVAGGDLSSRGRVAMIEDGAGGAVLVMGKSDPISFSDDLIVQRVDGAGTSLWGPAGKSLAAVPFFQEDPRIISDGAGGWIVAWVDERSAALADCEKLTGNCDVFAQRINSTGDPLWLLNGRPVSIAVGNQSHPRMVPDGAGGAIIAWQDCRYYNDGNFSCDFNRDIFAQRVDANGNRFWNTDGIAVSTAGFNQGVDFGTQNVPSFAMTTDQNHGAILAWPDGRNVPCPLSVGLPECDIYAQRVSDVLGAAPRADLSVTGTVSPTPAVIGVDQNYAVQVSNIGPQTAHGASLKLNLPSLIAAKAVAAGCLPTDFNFVICALGDLPGGSSATLNFTLANHTSGNFTNKAEVHATEIDPSAANNSASSSYSIAVDFTLIAGTASATVQAGQTATYNMIFRSQVEFLNTLPQMSCSGLPAGAACGFGPFVPVLGTLDTAGPLTITTTAPHTAQLRPANFPVVFAFAFPVVGAVLVGGFSRRKKWAIRSVLMLALLLSVAGCGGGGGSGPTPPVTVPGTPSGTYNITVTATTPAATRSTNLTLVVR